MAQNKKEISRSQENRHQYIRRKIEAGEVKLNTGATNTTVTYTRLITMVRPELQEPLLQFNAAGNCVSPVRYGGTVVSPVLHSFEYRKAWKQIADNYNNRS